MNDLEKKGLTENAMLRVRTELTVFTDILEVTSIDCTSASD